jgi:hypothetical protein
MYSRIMMIDAKFYRNNTIHDYVSKYYVVQIILSNHLLRLLHTESNPFMRFKAKQFVLHNFQYQPRI